MAADPKRSEGARLERKSIREYLRRALKRGGSVAAALAFVMTRQQRYDKKAGGLGSK